MSVPTLFVTGDAERLVTPDRVEVSVGVQTPVMRTAPEALARAAQGRRRLLDHLTAALPGASVADRRVTTREEQRRVEEELVGRTETRWEVEGYTGLCTLVVEDAAGRAAEIVGAAGGHADAAWVSPRFRLGPELERRTRDELEQEAVRDALARAAGLAAAAGMEAGRVISIGEGPEERPAFADRPLAAAMSREAAPADIEESLGELRPEPERRTAHVPVRVELREAPGGGA